ncbi:hypothetical protein M885DRAFT_503784 [Pelagophyceae sp. CCMP2097]|nr:hypothetical protein M885DRAFT_503784 [Pelagophyceae sp. CCMP2097]
MPFNPPRQRRQHRFRSVLRGEETAVDHMFGFCGLYPRSQRLTLATRVRHKEAIPPNEPPPHVFFGCLHKPEHPARVRDAVDSGVADSVHLECYPL